MEKFFKLKEQGTTVSTEVMAGITTFFAMSYILFVNPTILSASGMPFQAVFLATIIASVIGTLVMGLFANVPYAQAPGMGLNAFFTYTVVFGLGYSWQQALAMVFICGIINILITVTKIRKLIIHAIPESMQHAIGGGIGIFVAYVGIKNAGLLSFSADSSAITNSVVEGGKATSVSINSGIVPALANFNNAPILLAVIGLVLTTILVVKNVRGAILIGIIVTTVLGIPMGVVQLGAVDFHANSLGSSINELGTTFGAAFGAQGMGSLFSDSSKLSERSSEQVVEQVFSLKKMKKRWTMIHVVLKQKWIKPYLQMLSLLRSVLFSVHPIQRRMLNQLLVSVLVDEQV